METQRRTVRIDDELWDNLRRVADERGTNVSDELRNAAALVIKTHDTFDGESQEQEA
jgi:hypothetical protein